jgi:hypothetical protein
MKRCVCICLLFISLQSFCQSPIDVIESTFKVGGLSEESFYLGFAEGDQLIFEFEEMNGKELKELEIIELPGSSKFMDYKTKKVAGKTLSINRTGIYKFRFANSALGGRICKYKIQRIPVSENLKNFNTSVYWKTQYDTSFFSEPEQYLIKRNYIPKSIVPISDFYINSASNATFLGGKSRISIPVQLPRNTIEWFYQFSAARDKDAIDHTKQVFNLVGDLTKVIDETGALNFGIDKLTQPPGADFCDVYLMDFNNSQLFEAKENYRYFPEGSRENIKSGIIKMPGQNGGTYFIGMKNPDASYGVNVAIECVAIVVEEEWGTRNVQKFTVTKKEVPYLKN